jgi:integrase
MGRKKTSGLFLRDKIWHIDKQVDGVRLRESTGSASLAEANKYLAKRIEDIRQTVRYGMRPRRLFNEAAMKFLQENQHKASIRDDALQLRLLDPFIGALALESVHMGTLQNYMESRKKDGVKNRTVNNALQVVRRILNLAAGEWRDDHGLTWLLAAPKIKLLPLDDAKPPYPLSWEEQKRLFGELPPHLKQMALFAVNTGCRDNEICSLRWEWEHPVPELNTSVFIVPLKKVKNRMDRLVVLNQVAQEVIESARGQHPEYVFTFRGKPITHMLNTAWQRARTKTQLPSVRVHDLKHTLGRRLRAAGVNFEDRQDLLGHKSARITTHYSSAELKQLLIAANKVCTSDQESAPTITLLRNCHPHNIPTVPKLRNSAIAVSP